MSSEKSDFDPEPAVEKSDQDQDRDQNQSKDSSSDDSINPSPEPPSPKKPSRARLWKFFCYLFADSQLKCLHKFALTHAREAHRTRWEELTAWVSPWVTLFFVRIHPVVKVSSCYQSSASRPSEHMYWTELIVRLADQRFVMMCYRALSIRRSSQTSGTRK